jgi:hypothetical protein
MKKYIAGTAELKRPGFWGRELDPHQLAEQRQFIEQLEMSVTLANREVIHKQIPNLTRETFQQLAVMVARFRASYLDAAIRLSTAADPFDAKGLADLKLKRDLYDEGRAAFEALERAIERGYVDFGAKR